ncbi:class I adenylate-forming enzyme family protein [Pseudooceanicola sp. 502str34]
MDSVAKAPVRTAEDVAALRNLGALLAPAGQDPCLIEVDPDSTGPATEITRARLGAAVNAVAAQLQARGLAPGARVGLISGNRWEYIAAYLGIMAAGFVAVPVNFKLPRDTVTWLCGDAEMQLVFTDDARRDLCPVGLAQINFDHDWAALEAAGGSTAATLPAPGADAMILYTSGSTSLPKGVPLSHDGQLWALRNRLHNSPAYGSNRVIAAAPLYHMNALFTAKVALASGARLVLMRRFDAAGFVTAISDHDVTMVTSVPTMIALALREAEALAAADLSGVRFVGMGSAPVTEQLVKATKAAFPNAIVSLGYGTTESGPCAFGAHPEGLPKPALSLGYPLPDVDLQLRGGETRGELLIRTPAVMRGYLNNPEKTASVLDAEGWYATGDLMRRDAEGFFYFVGRADNMFTCGGENIYPENVEDMLNRHPGVAQACVVPVPDEVKGQKPVAFVVPQGTPTEAEIRSFALENGPSYQHPRRVIFLEEMPLAGTNKVDRAALTRRAADEAAACPPIAIAPPAAPLT